MKKFLCYDTNDAASGKINVDNRGMLRPNSTVPSNSGAPYQQLVTGRDGSVKWEDRLVYEGSSKLVVGLNGGMQAVKVADKVPSWMSVDAPTKIWTSDGENVTATIENNVGYDNGSFRIYAMVFAITEDNSVIRIHEDDEGCYTFPEKGVYFLVNSDGSYVSGIASADSDTPEITWDGNVEFTKTIDPKYIPSELNEVILPSSTSGSSKKFKITVDDTGTISATEYTT